MSIKATGIVRRVDELGRIVIPMELRKTLDIGDKEALEIFVDADKVVLKVYRPSCIFCGEVQDTSSYKQKLICSTCLNEIKTDEAKIS